MIFISHTSTDRDFVDRLTKDLIGWGFNLWYSPWELHAGDSITQHVQQALRASDCLIVVLSKKSCRAAWVKQELNSYLFQEISKRKGSIIPVMIEPCSPEFFIEDRLQIRFYEEGYDVAFLKLVFDLLRTHDQSPTKTVVDVFRKATYPVRSIKEFVLRQQKVMNDSRQVQADYVIVSDKRLLDVRKGGDVFCRIILDILLCKEKWDRSDWSDTLYDSNQEITLEGVGYQTNSNIIGHRFDQKTSSIFVDWEPHKALRAGQIYRHSFEFTVANGFLDPTEYWVHRRYDYPTLWTNVIFKCFNNIERIIPCRPPYTFELVEPWEFIAYAIRAQDKFTNISTSRNSVKIGMPSSELSDGLFVGLMFQGWQEYHEADRKSGSEKRNREFEQSWMIENKFRQEVGWSAVSKSRI